MDNQLSLQAAAAAESVSDSSEFIHRQSTWKDYIHLTKPGIIRSNLIAAFGGFWLASQWDINWLLMIYMLIGTTLVMASSTVLNNYLDREMDQKMVRTRNRALPMGRLKPAQVLWYGVALGVVGLIILAGINWLSALLGVVGLIVYVGIYTAWLKPTSTLSTAVGSISGSMPPIIGYCAVSGEMDSGAWILFAILFFWQPPHFWTLGIRRVEEYRAAGFRILPVVKGITRTKLQMIPYVLLLIPSTVLLFVYGYVGKVYLITAVLLGLVWLAMCIAGFWSRNDDWWAKSNFIFSINYLMITFIVMMIDTVHG